MTDIAPAAPAAEAPASEPSEIERMSDTLAEQLGFGGNEDAPDKTQENPGADADAQDTPEAQAEKDAAAAAAASAAVETPAPKSWAKETAAIWQGMSPEARAQVVKREEEMLRGLEQYREYHEAGRTLSAAIAPYQAKIAAHGMTADKAVASLFNTHYRLTEGPIEQRIAAFRQLGESFGLIQRSDPANDTRTPAERELAARLANLEGTLQERQQQAYREEYQRLDNDVASFETQKDAAGNLVHPYFAEVGEDIVQLLNANPKMTLKDAYEKAVWANPVTRAKEMERAEKATAAARAAKARKEAEDARKATQVNVKRRDTTSSPTGKTGTMDDTLHETLREINSRTRH